MIVHGRRTSGVLFLCWLFFFADMSIADDLLYDNGSSLNGSSFVSEEGVVNLNGTDYLIQGGDTFVLSQDATLSSIKWWGLNFNKMAGVDNAFEVTLYAIDNGTVSEVPFYTSQITAVSQIAGPSPGSFEYSGEVPPVFLSANTEYMLSIVNDFNTPTATDDYWAWARNSDGPGDSHSGKQSASPPTPGAWNKDGFSFDLSFQLSGSACPETGCYRPFMRGWRAALVVPKQ
jgi:hypothetical protein